MKDSNRLLLIGIFLLMLFYIVSNHNRGRYQLVSSRYGNDLVDTRTGTTYQQQDGKWKVDNVLSDELWKSPYDNLNEKPNDKYLEGWDD